MLNFKKLKMTVLYICCTFTFNPPPSSLEVYHGSEKKNHEALLRSTL